MCFKRKTMLDVVKECEKINQMLKDETVCFTGHRPQKLPWGFNESDEAGSREKAKKDLIGAIIGFVVIFVLIVGLKVLMPILQDWVSTQITV